MLTPAQAHRNITIHKRVNFLAGVTFTIPVIALLYTYTDLSLAQIILLSNISTMAMRILELPTSVFADTTGRKKSLTIAVVCNAIAAMLMFFFPSWRGFVAATIFSSLYFTFWSGTGQAFLEENLIVVGEQKQFAKHIGSLMFMEQIPGLFIPWIASGVLYFFVDHGWTILLGLDVISAIALVFLVLQYHNTSQSKVFSSFGVLIRENLAVARNSVSVVFSSPPLRLLVLFRSLSNHVSFLPLLILPYLQDNGMLEAQGGVVMGIIGAIGIIVVKYAYLVGDRVGYARAWILSSVMQAILLIVIGAIGGVSWRIIAVIFGVFTLWDNVRQPARNHLLVQQTQGVNTATVRSIIFSLFALYTTIGKQVLSWIPFETALIGLGVFLLIINVVVGPMIVKLEKEGESS